MKFISNNTIILLAVIVIGSLLSGCNSKENNDENDDSVSPDLITDKQPDYIISLDQFINPYLLDNNDFQGSYELIYEVNVKIVETNQPLYVFQRKGSLP